MEARRTDVLRASPRMFDSDLLDKLSRVHPAVPVIIFVPAIGVLFGLGVGRVSALGFLGLAAAGYAFWTVSEYWIHRAIFHFEPENGVGARLHWMIHGVHHDHPNDPLRLVMPPSVSVPLALLVLWGFWAVMGYDAMLVFGGAFLTGYLAYDMLHYHVHHHTPPSPAVAPRAGLVTSSPVAVQAAAVAVTGFAAGAATVAVVRRRRARRSLRAGRKALGEVRASRSFLVDIHLLNR